MLEQLDKNIVKRLQEDIPLEKEPYKTIAEELGITEDELFKRINNLLDKEVLRRIGAILHHRKAGFSHNAMVVWAVPDNRSTEIGTFMASLPSISHCYKRIVLDNWQYNMYTMIHGQTKEECEAVVSAISKQTGINEYKILYSIKELKKTSMKYFTD